MAKKDKLTYDNFGKFRHSWIFEADRICQDCEELRANPAKLNPQSGRYWRRAAKLYERAADFYRKAGLGLMAAAAWWAAAHSYEELSMADDYERCRLKATSIPPYYRGEEEEEGL